MSPVTMPLWKGKGTQNVFTATFDFCQQIMQGDPVVSRTIETLENVTAAGQACPAALNDVVSSSVSVFAKMIADAVNSSVQRNITDLEGLDLTPQPPRLTRRPRPFAGRSDSTLMPHPPRRHHKARGILAPEQPHVSLRKAAPPNFQESACMEMYY